jgi:hypothetical protein
MTGGVPTRLLRVLTLATLCWANPATTLWAEPITVTSGQLIHRWDDPSNFFFFGADGFVLRAGFIVVTNSPQETCFLGCAQGTAVDMSAVAGGEWPFIPYTLGIFGRANINGTEFTGLGLAGTFRFDAPVLVLPPLDEGASGIFTAPFVFNGVVTGFAHGDPPFAPDDADGRVPLFNVALVGKGTVKVHFDVFALGYDAAEVTYTFAATPAPIPEPTTLALLGVGLIGIGARAWRHKRTPHESS